jgi:phosphocarrier protein
MKCASVRAFTMKTVKSPRSGAVAGVPQAGSALCKTFVLMNRNGLHARPCALLTKTLRPLKCQVEVEANGGLANGYSIMGLMALAVSYQSRVTFTISGDDAARAMAAVERLFETRFEEAYE